MRPRRRLDSRFPPRRRVSTRRASPRDAPRGGYHALCHYLCAPSELAALWVDPAPSAAPASGAGASSALTRLLGAAGRRRRGRVVDARARATGIRPATRGWRLRRDDPHGRIRRRRRRRTVARVERGDERARGSTVELEAIDLAPARLFDADRPPRRCWWSEGRSRGTGPRRASARAPRTRGRTHRDSREGPEADAAAVEEEVEAAEARAKSDGTAMGPEPPSRRLSRARVIRGRVSSPHGTTIGGDASRGTRRCRRRRVAALRRRSTRALATVSVRSRRRAHRPAPPGSLSRACGIGAARVDSSRGWCAPSPRDLRRRRPGRRVRRRHGVSPRRVRKRRARRSDGRGTRIRRRRKREDDRISRRDFSARAKPSEKTPRAARRTIRSRNTSDVRSRHAFRAPSSLRVVVGRRDAPVSRGSRHAGFVDSRQDWTRWRRRRHARSCRWRGARARVRTPSDRT